jgi:hypothetical protein
MFHDDHQLARACRALLQTVGLQRLWTEHGPSDSAMELLEADGGPLSSGERVMLLAAFAFWNGSGGLTFVDVIERLDRERGEALGSLLMASYEGPTAIDEWVTEHEEPLL